LLNASTIALSSIGHLNVCVYYKQRERETTDVCVQYDRREREKGRKKERGRER